MVKRQTIKKEPKMKQKQKQQQNVVVNIGTAKPPPKKRKPRQTKAKVEQKPTAQIHQGILTRGPTTFYQQPQPIPNLMQAQSASHQQPIPQVQTQTINEIFRAIQQQQKTNIPDAPTIGGTLLNPAPTPTKQSIAPPAVVEAPAKQENDLEKVRKARVQKFQKPIETSLKTPKSNSLLQTVFNKEPLGQEDEAYQSFQQIRDLTAHFREAERKEPNLSLLEEFKEEPKMTEAINLYPQERIAEEVVKPNLSLQPSELLETPKTKGMGLKFASAFRNLVKENKQNEALYKLAKEEKWPVINITQEDLRRQRLKKLEPLPPKEPFFVSEEAPLSLLNVIEQTNVGGDILEGANVPMYNEPRMAFAFPAAAEEEKFEGITELNLEDQRPIEPPPPPLSAYKGGEFLPAIVKQPEAETTMQQLLAPTAQPSLVEAAAAAAEVRQPDISITERLVKGPPAAASEIPQGTPKFRLFMLAQSLNADLSTTGGKKLKTDEIKQRIIDKMGEDYVIPDFKAEAKKPGPRAKVRKEELVVEDA